MIRQTSLVLVGVLLGCTRPSPTGVAFPREVHEPSGLTASTHDPAVFWTHGDSGTGNWMYAVTVDGKLLAKARLAGVDNVDWEDITHDEAGNLWLGDIGNNDSSRHDLAVYRIPEPSSLTGLGQLESDLRVGFRYPEQQSYGDPALNFDSEALFWWRDTLWVLTKHRSDDLTRLYRFPDLGGEAVALEQVASYDLGASLEGQRAAWSGQVSGAEVSPDGKHLAMLTYDALFVFAMPASGEGTALFDELVNRIAFDMQVLAQVEAVSWDGGSIVLVNEARAVFRIDDPLTRPRYP